MGILVVDDTEEVREIFEVVLAGGGHQNVITVDSAAAAFSLLALATPLAPDPPPVDVILLDIIMPDMDGIQACACIRRDPRYAEVPIVMAKAISDLEGVDKAFQCGATD